MAENWPQRVRKAGRHATNKGDEPYSSTPKVERVLPVRLTLRYLLAYMDEQLEPADAEELAAKLEKSEYAKSLLHRIRDVTRRLRLGAPRLDARGMGFDANTVAEYLDNALPDDRVPDFEKICLESDMHLAEVAACHQILALVLGEPAQVDPAARKRMYGLAASPPTRVDQPSPPPKPKSAKDRRSRAKRKKPKVPEYLKDSPPPRGRRRLIGAISLLLLVGAVLLTILGPGRLWRLTLGRGGSRPPESKVDSAGHVGASPQAREQPSSPRTRRGGEPQRAPAPASSKRGKSKATTTHATTQPERPQLDRPDGDDRQPEPSDAQAPEPPQPEQGTQGEAQTPPQADGAAAGRSTEPANAGAGGAPASPEAAETQPASEQRAPAAADEDESAAPGANLGRLILEHDVLLRWQPASDQGAAESWVRLADRSPIYAGDLLLALPNYDPHLALVDSVTIQVLGGTRLELLAPDESGTAGVRLVSGRIMVWSNGKPAARLRIVVGDHQGTLVLDDPDATAGIEVRRELRPGADPRQEPSLVMVDLYANFGNISWQAANGESTLLKAPGSLPLDGRPLPPQPPADDGDAKDSSPEQGASLRLPAWMASSSLSPIDKRAADIVEQHLARPERAVSLGLRELFADRRVEVRLLATQCLAETGEFDLFPGIFNDASHRALWAKALASLRAQLALSPQTALAISDAFARVRGPRAEALFRMLYGYSDEQLAAGAAEELVAALEHEDLDARVLAFLNLREITGASHYYEPHGNPKKREQAVRLWRERLEKGDIARKSAARS